MIPPAEGRRKTGLAFLYFFLLVAGCAMLRPLRDEVALRGGIARMPWLFTGSLLATLLVIPLSARAASRCPRRVYFPAMNLFLAGNLVLFHAAFRHPSLLRGAEAAFFLWLNVFSLLSISFAWSVMSDVFTAEHARRAFGLVAGGASLGSIAGPAAATLAAAHGRPETLLLLAAAMLAGAAGTARMLLAGRREEEPLRAGALTALSSAFRSPILRRLAVIMACSTAVSTIAYFWQAEIVGAAITDTRLRTQYFATIDLSVNALAALLQLFVTGQAIRRFGIAASLVAVSALVTLAAAAVGLAPGLATVVALQLIHRIGHFAVGRPAREVLLVPLGADERFHAKNFIDTAVYRAGDAGSAWALSALRATGAGFHAVAGIAVAIGIVWTATNSGVGRREVPSPDLAR